MTMTYKQFRELPELEGFELKKESFRNSIDLLESKSGKCVATFWNNGIFKNDYTEMHRVSSEKRIAITVALFELMMTPIDEREEPKQYYIHRVPEMGKYGFLIECIEGTKGYTKGNIRIGLACINANNMYWKPRFTMEEVRKLEVKYDEDYSGMLEEAEGE